MPMRRRYHFAVYEPGSKHPNLFQVNPLYFYPSLEAARKAAHEYACAHDGGVRVDILDDGHVVEHVMPCKD